MGLCPSLSPEERVIAKLNSNLKIILEKHLKDLLMYNFTSSLQAVIPGLSARYLLTVDLVEDIDKIQAKSVMTNSMMIQSTSTWGQFLEQDAQDSCIILEDEAIANNDKIESGLDSDVTHSFKANMAQHQSLVVQMNIMYKRDFEINEYKDSLKLFLQWSSLLEENCYGGFLKPLYQQFCKSLYQLPVNELETIVDETNVFVQYLVTVYTEVYHLDQINQGVNGCLFRNENIYNLIMSLLFQKTKIKRFIRKAIQHRDERNIQKFTQKLGEFRHKHIAFFGVNPEFSLIVKEISANKEAQKHNLQEGVESEQADMNKQQQQQVPYSQCFMLVQQLSEQSNHSPISKLKVVVALSKQIMKCIYAYYDHVKQECPDLDPDSLNSIVMYLISRAGKPSLLEELKIIQYFTTTNYMNSISGFYLNTFAAAVQSLLEM